MVGVIHRDPASATAATYDVIVVGGGVYGVAVAQRATRLGLRPLLIERDDFGGATSANSLRILHGGIRSLQAFDLECFRDMCVAQSWFLRYFPEHITPLECLMPLYGRGLRRPGAFRVALVLDQLLRRACGQGYRSSVLPTGTVLDANATRQRFPLVPSADLQGGGIWYDAIMRHPQRVLIDWLRWACAGGATALNRVTAQQLLVKDGRVAGVVACDGVAGTSLFFRGSTVINCAGPWSEALGRAFDPKSPGCFRPTLAFNLLLDRIPIAPCAVAVATPIGSRRTYFIVPWGNHTMVGTYHDTCSGLPHQPSPSLEQIDQMLRELNAAVPGWDLQPEAVVRVYSGLLPGSAGAGEEPLQTDATVHDHGRSGGPRGLFTVAGVKFTTAPIVAARALRVAGFRTGSSVVEVPRPPAREMPDALGFRRTLASAPAHAADWLRRLAAEESVLSVEDFLHRRTDWALDPRDERELVSMIRTLMPEMGAAPQSLTRARAG
jgi:glycerol-3-phosphate dehydrogenase